jgi:hypothetical protein
MKANLSDLIEKAYVHGEAKAGSWYAHLDLSGHISVYRDQYIIFRLNLDTKEIELLRSDLTPHDKASMTKALTWMEGK